MNPIALEIKKFNQEYGEASTRVHNAQQTLDGRERRARKLAKQIKVRQTELDDAEGSMSRLVVKIAAAKEELQAAKDIYRPLRQQWKLLNPKQGEQR